MSSLLYHALRKTKIKHILLLALFLSPLYWLRIHVVEAPSLQGPAQIAIGLDANSTLFSLSEKVSSYYHLLSPTADIPLNTSLKANISTPAWVTADITTSKKVAAIVETRRSGNIVPLVLHFATVLGPDWPVVIYTDAENFGSFSSSAALTRFQKAGRIVLRPLANGVYFPSWDSVTTFLTNRWLWDDLAPAENILLFQSDSILCSNSVRSVEEFFEWDFIGAPIDPSRAAPGYNGGLSLRKRKTVLRVLEEWKDPQEKRHPEDQWYYKQ